jgi:hypothetical protein
VPRATCPHCAGEIELSTVGTQWQVRSPGDVADRLVLQIGTLEREELHVILLNANHVVIDQQRVYAGNVSASLVRIGELFTEAIRRQAKAILIVHNHPSGDPTPSPDDVQLTAEAIAAGRLLDIEVLDHIVVAGGSWASLRDRGVAFGMRARSWSVRERSRRAHAILRLEGERIVDENDRVYDVDEAIQAIPWVTALSSSGSPHQYAVDRRCPTEAWAVLTTVIAKHPGSYLGFHRGYQRATRYWEHGEHRYWKTASRTYGGFTEMVNRCLLESDTPRRVDQGAKPAVWVGPPWLEDGSPWPPGYIEENGRHVYYPRLDPRQHYRCADCGHRMFWEPGRTCSRCGTQAPIDWR